MQFKRQRIKTGHNSWINITTRQNGTSFRSVSNKGGNTTTNISSKGVRKTQNNNGWIKREFWSANPKSKSSNKKAAHKNFFFKSSKKKKNTSLKQRQQYDRIPWSETKTDLRQCWKDITSFGEPVPEDQFRAIAILSVIGVIIWILIFGH